MGKVPLSVIRLPARSGGRAVASTYIGAEAGTASEGGQKESGQTCGVERLCAYPLRGLPQRGDFLPACTYHTVHLSELQSQDGSWEALFGLYPL